MMNGVKYDNDKPDYTLLPFNALEDVVNVLTFGAKKYDRHNWKKVDNLDLRYQAAAYRHMIAYSKGEEIDSESGLPHLAHAVCCLMFMMEAKQIVQPAKAVDHEFVPYEGRMYESIKRDKSTCNGCAFSHDVDGCDGINEVRSCLGGVIFMETL